MGGEDRPKPNKDEEEAMDEADKVEEEVGFGLLRRATRSDCCWIQR